MKKRNNLSSIIPLLVAFGGMELIPETTQETNWNEIKKEYGLIKQKKSFLSARERNFIIRQWEKHIKKGII